MDGSRSPKKEIKIIKLTKLEYFKDKGGVIIFYCLFMFVNAIWW